MCFTAALWARVDRIVFAATRQDAREAGFDDARFYEELACGEGERELALEELGRDRARAVFAEWLAKEDRRPY
jgi:tRNA(Arg) A34 adenosine deaminase TadA